MSSGHCERGTSSMERVLYLFLAIGIGMAIFAWLTIWSRRELRVRGLAVLLLLLWALALPLIAVETLGWHRPSWAAWRLNGEEMVIGSKMVEGQAIYLYLETGELEPRAIKLPWSTSVAQALQDALRESQRRGRRGAIMEFNWSWDQNGPQFHPLPQPALPMPKVEQAEPPVQYDRIQQERILRR